MNDRGDRGYGRDRDRDRDRDFDRDMDGGDGECGGFCRRKVSPYYTELNRNLDYKDVNAVKYFISDRGKIVFCRISRLSAKDQRKVAKAIKRSRALGLVPFTITAI
jgi:small subunit ribosomal protein S18